MSENSSDRKAIADIYAQALLEAAADNGQEGMVAEQLADLVTYMDGHPDFYAFLTAQGVDDDKRRTSLEKIFRGRMNDLLLNLLQVLNNHGRCGLIRDVQSCTDLGMKQRRNQQDVLVETALPLMAELKQAIAGQISERINKQAIVIEKVNPDLIGGVVIHIGDLLIDGSVTALMHNMQKHLYAGAQQAVSDGRGF